MKYKTLAEIKSHFPEFFTPDMNDHHGTKKIHKRGDCVILVNQKEPDWPVTYAVYYCDWAEIHFIAHPKSEAIAELLAALVNEIGYEKYCELEEKARRNQRGT